MLYQLLHLDETPASAVHGALEDEDQSSRWKSEHSSSDHWTFSRLRDVFKSVVVRSPTGFRTVYILDALDECVEGLPDFLESIVDILRARAPSTVKFLLLSRPILSLSMDSRFKLVGGLFRIIMNDNAAHIHSIERFIQTKVDDLCKFRPGLSYLRSQIVEELAQHSAGIYLLASLNLKSLATAKATPANIRSVIRTLPGDLQAIYSQALEKVVPEDRLRAAALLLWVVFAVRPLKQWELSVAVALTCLDHPITTIDMFKDEVSLDILGETGIHELVGPLIRVTGGDVVSLVHSSARQYLLSLAPTSSTQKASGIHDWVWRWVTARKGWKFVSIDAMASRVLSLNCQDLISLASRIGISASAPAPTLVDSPDAGIQCLLLYAVENLPDHVRQAPPRQDTHDVFVAFLGSDYGTAWIQQFWRLKDPTQAYRAFQPLELCCALGLVEAVKRILPLDKYPRPCPRDAQAVARIGIGATELLTAANIAAVFGNVEVLRVLCEDMRTPTNSHATIPGIMLTYFTSAEGQDLTNARDEAIEQLSWYRPLHTATEYGHIEAVEYLLSQGASISQPDEYRRWPIEIAMEKGLEALVRLLLRRHQHDLPRLARRLVEVGTKQFIELLMQWHSEAMTNGLHLKSAQGQRNGSILHVAAAVGNLSVYEFLVGRGLEVRLADSEGRQAIHYAAASGQESFLRSILGGGLSTGAEEDALGRNALFYAALGASCLDDTWTPVFKREHLIRSLVGTANPTLRDDMVRSALRSLAKFPYDTIKIARTQVDGLESCLRTLRSLVPGIDLDGVFLHSAVESTLFPVTIALDFAHDVNETDSRGRTALHVAAATARAWDTGHKKLADTMRDVDQRDGDGTTALLVAIHSADGSRAHTTCLVPMIKVLLGRGADPTCADVRGITPISAAAQLLLNTIYRRGTSQETHVKDGLLAILLSRHSNAAECLSDEMLRRLIAALSTSERSNDLKSLMSAMSLRQRTQWLERNEAPVTVCLLSACQELDLPFETISAMALKMDIAQLRDAYHSAFKQCSRAMFEMCRSYLKDRGDSSWRDLEHMHTYLFKAIRDGSIDTVKFFLDIAEGNVNTVAHDGQTMLSHAAEAGQVEITKHLLSCGADWSIPDRRGKAAVFWAAREGKLDALKLLLKAGASVRDEDVAIAASMGRQAIEDLLKEHLQR
jgi:ankyrin repeat protein